MEKDEESSLEAELRQFTGTQRYFRGFTGILYTEGIEYLAERAGAYWLIDLVGSYQHRPPAASCPFQVWKLEVRDDASARVTMVEDDGLPARVSQEIPFTDFPLREFSWYCIDGVMLLKWEH